MNPRTRSFRWSLLTILVILPAPTRAADPPREPLDCAVADPELKVVRIDSSPTESFLAVRPDAAGRLFVGGRQALFVYEPDGKGSYQSRKRLVEFPNHTWVYDIAIRGHDLYALTLSALYVIRDGVVKRDNLQVKRLVWGVPMGHVHQCFHALAWGPEGDLYFSMGDPLWYYGDFSRPDHWGHWTFFSQPEGKRTPYTGVGGVFRCAPDGADFQVVARGLRNPCGLAFDRHWNLFSNDNDHEQMPAEYVPGRLLHVTPYADFGWPRGWLVSKSPRRADLLETMFDGMGRAVPVGQAYYHETFLPARYRDNLLVARWCTRSLVRYPIKPHGATFRATEEKPVLIGKNNARPVGVAVGRGGRVFVTVAHMAHNEDSPVYRSDLLMLTRADDPPAHPFDAYDPVTAPAEKLWKELSDPSWHQRLTAHVEILRNEQMVRDAAPRLAATRADDPAFPHLIWLTGANQRAEAGRFVRPLLKSNDANIRLQALRAVSEYPSLNPPFTDFERALDDPDPKVRHTAVLAYFLLPDKIPGRLIEGPGCDTDTYLRQSSALLLAERVPANELKELCLADDPAVRLLGVLAAGSKLTLPPATESLPARLPLDKLRNEEAYVVQYADAKIDLRRGGRVGNFTVADHWKRGGHTAEQNALFDVLVNRLLDKDEQVRLQAAHYLYLLNDPRSEPQVARVRKASDERRLRVAPLRTVGKVWAVGPFPDGAAGLKTVHPPERGPIDLAAAYPLNGEKRTWREIDRAYHFDLVKHFGPCDRSSFYAYFRLESASRQPAHLLLGSDDGVKVWHNGKEVWSNPVVRGALPTQDTVSLDLQPGSNDLLVRVQNVTGACELYLHYRTLREATDRLPEKLDIATLAERLKAGGKQNPIGPEFLKLDWDKEVPKGDPVKGRQLFGALACAKCHAVTADAAVAGGPSLAESRKRFTVPYLVEAVLLPSKQISPVFRASLIETKAGKVVTGLVISETADKVEVLLADATRQTIAKNDIAERKLQDVSPMPGGVVKTPAELRDLLAYLLSENPSPP